MANVRVEKLKKEDVFQDGGSVYEVVAKVETYERNGEEWVDIPTRNIATNERKILNARKGTRVLRMDIP